jgi:hypothetical protein
MAEDEPKEPDEGFTVKDHRRFSGSGEERPDAADGPDAAQTSDAEQDPLEAAHAAAQEASQSAPGAAPDDAPRGGEINFSSFAFGLASQALMLLGLAPDPATGAVEKDLAGAKGLIDILAMLEEKTRGNLDEDEAHMMEEMLYELRMQFVRETRAQSDPQETT